MSNGRFDFRSVPTDELWLLFEDIAATLMDRLSGEKRALQDCLRGLNELTTVGSADEPVKCRSLIQ